MKRITDKQMAVLEFCGRFFAANDQLPTAVAIAQQFGWVSANASWQVLYALQGKGYLERNSLGKFKFTAKGRAAITERLTAARWHPTNGTVDPTNGMYA
jgi:SOS-response transcriptional repressor LexA